MTGNHRQPQMRDYFIKTTNHDMNADVGKQRSFAAAINFCDQFVKAERLPLFPQCPKYRVLAE